MRLNESLSFDEWFGMFSVVVCKRFGKIFYLVTIKVSAENLLNVANVECRCFFSDPFVFFFIFSYTRYMNDVTYIR